MRITEGQLRRIIREELLREGTDEEAWELLGQKDPNIRDVMRATGLGYDQESVDKLVPIIDGIEETHITPDEVAELKNFANRPGQEHLIDAMRSASRSRDPRAAYASAMQSRDAGEGRSRGYDPTDNYDRVVSGNYEPPVLIEIDGELYVIGGRTRLYAALASDSDVRVKILRPSDLDAISGGRTSIK